MNIKALMNIIAMLEKPALILTTFVIMFMAMASCSRTYESKTKVSEKKHTETHSEFPAETERIFAESTEPKAIDKYTEIHIELPTETERASLIQLDIPKSEEAELISMGKDYIAYSIRDQEKRDEHDYTFYKIFFPSKEITPIDGYAPSYNSDSGVYAVCDDTVYKIYESMTERKFCKIDLKNNTVEIFRTEILNTDTDSFYFTYPLSENRYAVRWFNFNNKSGNLRTHHIAVCDELTETEVFSKTADTNKSFNQYTVANDKIYELEYDISAKEISVSIYDLTGKLLSENYFDEASAAMASSDSTEIIRFEAFGSSVSINIIDENTMIETTHIYNLENHTYMKFEKLHENLRLLPNNTDNITDSFVFELFKDSDSGTLIDLYVLDENANEFYKIADNLDLFSSVITDGEKVAYKQDGKIIIQEI